MPVWSCAIIQVCERPLPYLTCSLRTLLLFYNQSVVMLLFFINSVHTTLGKGSGNEIKSGVCKDTVIQGSDQ